MVPRLKHVCASRPPLTRAGRPAGPAGSGTRGLPRPAQMPLSLGIVHLDDDRLSPRAGDAVADHGPQEGAAQDRSRQDVLFPGLRGPRTTRIHSGRTDSVTVRPAGRLALQARIRCPSASAVITELSLVLARRPPFRGCCCPHELRGEPALRPKVDLRRACPTCSTPAPVQDGDPVGDGHRLLLVVGDVNRGDAQSLLDSPDLLAHAHPELCVEVGEGLVHEEDLGRDDQRPGQGDPLLLPPAELAGGPVLQAFELDAFDDLGRSGRPSPRRRDLSRPQTVGDVVETDRWGKRA